MSRDKYPDENTPETNGVVRPLPNPSTGSANPSASLPALWGYLQPALDHIVRGPTTNTSKAPAIEVSYHMGVHTAVYNYFTSQADSGLPHAPPSMSGKAVADRRHQDVKPSGTDLYEQLDRYYAGTTHEILLGAPHDDSNLIHYLLPCFQRYSAGAYSVNRLLNYVNRHYVKRAVDEDKGWLRLADFFDAVAKSLQDNDARNVIQRRLREKRVEELKKWGWYEGAPSEVLARTEASAEAASSPDRVVPLSSMALRRFRTEIIMPLLAVPGNKKGGKKKKPPAKGDKAVPRGRLARAVKELLEGEAHDPDERVKTAGELAVMLRTVGIRADQPLRKKLDKYAPDT
ncbi:hypothetical protein BDY19DRAFT_981824 [Irpex rosettiformis]|uniref:Uncharacterized protein n=1 Tax=Irpex rosettiformis TaxID=378272 RepID=A0ACB8UIX6_9APHY|nr:hypothetical protein BDY19DRAFT_981824 [Irpex rosettiformis]